MISAATFEHIVRIVYEHPSLKIQQLKTNTLEAYVNPPNDIYSLFLYLSHPLELLSSEAHFQFNWMLSEKYDGQIIDFWEIIRILNEEIFELKSIKIKSLVPLSHEDLNRISKVYLFKCAYRYNAFVSMISLFKGLNPLYPNDNRFSYTDESLVKLDINEELLNYYQQGVRFSDPFESFLSFYHIFEYFFRLVADEFKNDIIVSNNFEGSEDDFKKILSSCLNDEKRLELVFRKFINKHLFKAELYRFDPNYYSYLENNNVIFAEAKKINNDKFYKTISDRVYKVRNALVHRKEWIDYHKYVPTNIEHRKELRQELLLMKIIANQIIIKNKGTILHW